MTRLFSALAGLWQLARLVALSRGRLRGKYWSWRQETAFGRGMPANRRETLKATLDYGRWMARVRKLGRPMR